MSRAEIENAACKYCGFDTDDLDGTVRSRIRMDCFIAGAEFRQPEINELVNALRISFYYANYGFSEDGRRVYELLEKYKS